MNRSEESGSPNPPSDQCSCWSCGRNYVYDVQLAKFTPSCGCSWMLTMGDEGPFPPPPQLLTSGETP